MITPFTYHRYSMHTTMSLIAVLLSVVVSCTHSTTTTTPTDESTTPIPKMVNIPAGSFVRSDGKTITISAFSMSNHEVTQKEWLLVFDTNPIHPTVEKGDLFPVDNMGYYAAIAYCNKRSALEGLDPCYTVGSSSVDWKTVSYIGIPKSGTVKCDFTKNGYRLPTEAEWEYAARGGLPGNGIWAGTANKNELGDYGWYRDNSGTKVHPVMQKKPNGFGLYDMSGNLHEWVWDYYADAYTNETDNPQGPTTGSTWVYRGGDFRKDADDVTVSKRRNGGTDYREFIGIRVCRSVTE